MKSSFNWLVSVKQYILLLGVCTVFWSCTNENGEANKVDFDRNAMLVHWYDQLIIPAFTEFEQTTERLFNAFDDFEKNPNETTKTALQNSFLDAYKAFQFVKFYETGPSASLSLKANLNTYPTDTIKIENMVNTGSFNGGAANQLNAQGFPALDYLLFSSKVNLGSLAYRDIAKQNVQFIQTLAKQVKTNWLAYRSTFINANGTDVGSSLGQIVNSLNQDYELVKNAKIGFPAGKKTFGTPYPKAVEAYYAQASIPLAVANLRAIHQFYKGTSSFNSSVGNSLYDNLLATNTQAEGKSLADLIDEQLSDAILKTQAINGALSDAVVNNTSSVDAAYSAIQLTVIYLKTDMPSALGVIITYQDNDGD